MMTDREPNGRDVTENEPRQRKTIMLPRSVVDDDLSWLSDDDALVVYPTDDEPLLNREETAVIPNNIFVNKPRLFPLGTQVTRKFKGRSYSCVVAGHFNQLAEDGETLTGASMNWIVPGRTKTRRIRDEVLSDEDMRRMQELGQITVQPPVDSWQEAPHTYPTGTMMGREFPDGASGSTKMFVGCLIGHRVDYEGEGNMLNYVVYEDLDHHEMDDDELAPFVVQEAAVSSSNVKAGN